MKTDNKLTTSLPQRPTTVKPVAIYCRVSTDDQERDGTSLDTQRQSCLKYCQDHNYAATHQFSETWTGLAIERPQLDELRELVRNEEIAGIVVHSIDRLSRDPAHGAILQNEFETHHVTLEAVTETVESTEVGKLITYIRGYAAKAEAEKIRERTMRGSRARVYDKRLPVTYRQPFGYSWDKVNNRLVPDSNYDTVKLILDLAIEGKTYDFIIAELKKRGIVSPGGLPEWNKHTISAIVRNPVYVGEYYALKSHVAEPIKRNGSSYGKSSQRRLPQGEWYHIPEIEVVNPPMTKDQRALLLDQIDKRQKLSKRHANADYLLRGMVLCGTHKGKQGEPRRYHGQPYHSNWRYVCPAHSPNDPCAKPYIDGPVLEVLVRRVILEMFAMQPEEFYQTLNDTKNKHETKAALHKELRNLEDKHNRTINALAKLQDDHYQDNINPEAYQRLKAKYETDLTRIKDKQDEKMDQFGQLGHMEDVINSVKELYDLFWKNITIGDKLPFDQVTQNQWRQILTMLNMEIYPTEGKKVPQRYDINTKLGILNTLKEGRFISKEMEIRFSIPLKAKAIADIVLHGPEPG